MSRRLAHFRNIHTIYLFLVVYLQRNERQTTDQLPMTLAACGRDNFIARCTVLGAHARKNNRQQHTQQIDRLLAAPDKQLIDCEIYWTFIRESSHILLDRSADPQFLE